MAEHLHSKFGRTDTRMVVITLSIILFSFVYSNLTQTEIRQGAGFVFVDSTLTRDARLGSIQYSTAYILRNLTAF